MSKWTWEWLVGIGALAMVAAWPWWALASNANEEDREVAEYLCAFRNELDCDLPSVSPVPMILLACAGAFAVLLGVILRGQRVTSPS